MKNFTVIARNIKNGHCIIVTTFNAKTVKEARQFAAQNYMMYLEANEQMIVANDAQYEEFWRDAVEATDKLIG